jgi:prepilin-type processing-associated H-X9-DG protein
LYNHDHKEAVIPSYNMTGVMGGAGVPLDGWGPILDRDGYMAGANSSVSNPFYCPETVDVAGVANGPTGTDPNKSKGWLDWPFVRLPDANVNVTIPERGFDKVIRVAYWINANNPIGAQTTVVPDLFYTSSVGYGPGTDGATVRQTKLSAFTRPASLIAAADGLYAGHQRDSQRGMENSRIGYRHIGNGGTANAGFADGHVASFANKEFPRAYGGNNVPAEVRAENSNGKPTVYANPERALGQ